MKKNFKSPINRIMYKEEKEEHTKKMISVAMKGLIGVANLALGIGISIAHSAFASTLVLSGGLLSCFAIGVMIREIKRHKQEIEKIEKDDEISNTEKGEANAK